MRPASGISTSSMFAGQPPVVLLARGGLAPFRPRLFSRLVGDPRLLAELKAPIDVERGVTDLAQPRRLELWSGWDGAAPPPVEGEPRRRLLHPQCI